MGGRGALEAAPAVPRNTLTNPLTGVVGFEPKCLRAPAPGPFGREAGVGAPIPETPIQESPCQLTPLAGFGPKFLRAPALQPFGREAGVGAPFPETPYRGPRSSSDPNPLGPRFCSRLEGRPA